MMTNLVTLIANTIGLPLGRDLPGYDCVTVDEDDVRKLAEAVTEWFAAREAEREGFKLLFEMGEKIGELEQRLADETAHRTRYEPRYLYFPGYGYFDACPNPHENGKFFTEAEVRRRVEKDAQNPKPSPTIGADDDEGGE